MFMQYTTCIYLGTVYENIMGLYNIYNLYYTGWDTCHVQTVYVHHGYYMMIWEEVNLNQ